MTFTRTVVAHVDIAAAPQDVYAVLTDLEAYEQWNPFMIRGTGTFAVGDRVSLRMSPQGGRDMTFKPKVLAAEPGKELRWLGSLGPARIFDGEHAFVLQATPTGTRLTQSETHPRAPGPRVREAHRAHGERLRPAQRRAQAPRRGDLRRVHPGSAAGRAC